MSLLDKYSRILSVLLFLCISVLLNAQKGESQEVRFRLNNIPDTEGPLIQIHSPEPGENGLFLTEKQELEVIGEVKDASQIRFISVNSDIKMVDASGLFASTLSLNQGENEVRICSMDEHGNRNEVLIRVNYTPPVITLADRIHKNSTYYGLIIGIGDYKDPKIPDLENPVKDAQRVYQSLVQNYTFDRDNITLLKNPKRSDIIWELDELRSKVGEDDNLLIFYAGHGYWDDDAEIGYWLPSDATRGTTADWFRNSALVDYLQAIDSKHTLLITDACFAGSIFKTRAVNMEQELVYDRIYDIPSRKAMTSGALTEVPDKSAFVKYLVRRLEDNQKQYLSSEELFYSFKMAVISNSSQNVLPQYGEIQNVGNEGGDFIFLKKDE